MDNGKPRIKFNTALTSNNISQEDSVSPYPPFRYAIRLLQCHNRQSQDIDEALTICLTLLTRGDICQGSYPILHAIIHLAIAQSASESNVLDDQNRKEHLDLARSLVRSIKHDCSRRDGTHRSVTDVDNDKAMLERMEAFIAKEQQKIREELMMVRDKIRKQREWEQDQMNWVMAQKMNSAMDTRTRPGFW